ncbi:MAG: M23 family metallopeptidase [Xenococcaceae cyanobacterium MO_167.B27]|nr:M23 family metallopeptidase [Xenococcaceae cyanobacterium MO_167.B27]
MFFSFRNQVIVLTTLVLTLAVGCVGSLNSQDSLPKLGIPIDCNLGEDCFIMLYVDREPSSEAKDFSCGRQTYDGHKGTDFAISDLEVAQEGVPVLAAASGTVLRVRDGIPDDLVDSPEERQAIAARECGNGIVIDHGNGWETQYCHLRNGSIAVKPGMTIDKGAVLGMVGASGLASFPHVHITVRHQQKIIDPFGGVDNTSGCDIDNQNSLWDESLTYTPTGLIRAGFAATPPNQTELWQGKYKDTQLPRNIPALLFWVQAYGVLQGDVEKWQLTSPSGEVVLNRDNILDKSYRSWIGYSGTRRIASGVWQGKYQLWRGNKLIFEVKKDVRVL